MFLSGESCQMLPVSLREQIRRGKHFIESNKWAQWIFYSVKDIVSIYIDLLKDIYIVITIVLAIANVESHCSIPPGFTSVIVYCIYGSFV